MRNQAGHPRPGKLGAELSRRFRVRVDSQYYTDYVVPSNYDSLLVIIVWGENRLDAIQRMKRVLAEFIISPIKNYDSISYYDDGDEGFSQRQFSIQIFGWDECS